MSAKHVIALSKLMKFFKYEENLGARGENAVESGHVINMMYDSHLHTVSGKVHASMKDRKYDVEIEFNIYRSIKSGKCNCPRGQLRCHHMAALLLFARDNVATMDKECTWNKPKTSKEREVVRIKYSYPSEPHRATERNLTEKEKNFKNELSVFEGAVGFSWLLADDVAADQENFVVNIEDILFIEEYLSSQDKVLCFVNELKIENNAIIELAGETIGQANNPKWLVVRKNRLTASNFSVVLAACHRQRYPPSLFKRLSGAYNLEHIKAVQWGKAHEKEGIEALEKALDVKVNPTGLWLHQCGFLGASPDGFIGDHDLVEVKCPYKYRNQPLSEALRTVEDYIVVFGSDENLTVNRSHEYFYQIQGQLAITNRKKTHVVTWTPQETYVMDIEAEDFDKNLKILKKIYLEHYIPFLLEGTYVSD